MNCYVGHFTGVKALVCGDAIIDRYHFGRCDRLSPEAPVPVFVETSKTDREGGAANVTHQLVALNAAVSARYGSPESVKHRYFVGSHYLFRLDEDHQTNPSIEYDFDVLVHGYQVIVLSDYAKGFLTEHFCRQIIQAATIAEIPVVVDPKGTDWTKYVGAAVICPNHLELAQFGAIKASVMFPTVVEKCGADGIRVHQGDLIKSYKALNTKPVDVTGAGDTVTSIVALGVATDMPMHLIAQLANEAAAVVVGKVGTAVVYASELNS